MTGATGNGWQVESIDNWGLSADPARQGTIDEPMGTKEKFWVRSPEGREVLFKYARVRHGRTMGEDWVEWAVHQLASLLSIPTAVAIPALHAGRRGVLSVSILARGENLVHGNELLARSDPSYDSETSRRNPGYTVDAVVEALRGISAPRGSATAIRSAFDAWAGYLVLDAWVAGRDRHHQNWAAIERTGQLRLAPSFDHGNALGFQEPEPEVERLARDFDHLTRWVERGRSPHFAGQPSLVDLALDALDRTDVEVRAYWLGALAEVSDREVESVLARVPASYLSEAGRTFRVKLLQVNRERILHGR